MPQVGVPNNPDGVNSFSGFADEPQYGEATKDASLARAAPMAGAAVASGPIAAPKRAGRHARQGNPPQPVPPQPANMPPQELSPDAQLAQRWQAIAAVPGASDLVKVYAAAAAQRAAGG